MTSANKFTYDVVANDNASATTKKITESIRELVPALEAAAVAYERIAAAQAKYNAGGRGNQAVGSRAAATAARAEEAATRSASKAAEDSAKATYAAISQRATIIARSGEQERSTLVQLTALRERYTALVNREAGVAAAKNGNTGPLREEVARTRELVAEKQRLLVIAQQLAAATAAGNTGSALGGSGLRSAGSGGEGAARAAAAAATALKQAQSSLAGATGDNTRATAALNKELTNEAYQLASVERAAAANEVRLNTMRYALYQVSAGYAAVAKGAIGAVQDIEQTAVGFQAAFAQVARTTNLGAEIRDGSEEAQAQLGLIYDDLTKLSTQIPTTFGDLAQVASLGAQLGIAATDVAGFAETVTKFAATTDVTAESTANYFGRLQNLLGITPNQFNNLGSAISELGTASVATESDILSVTTQIAAVGTNAGLSAPYVIGLGTALASLRVAPELARGATTRIFADITRATAEGGPKLDAYAKVLGVTSEAAATLFEKNPEQFFSTFISNLGHASEAGQNLTLVLDDLGIKNSRDVQVVTRLAQGYKLLGDYTAQAASSFEAGTYLDKSFQTIAETTQASLTKMAGAFALFKNSLGQAFLKPLGDVADVLNNLFTALSKVPAYITAPIVGIVAAIGVFFAYKAALTLVTAGMLAFRVASNQMQGGALTLRGLLGLLTVQTKAQAVASTEATAAMGRHAAATTAAAAATGAAVASTGVLTTELIAESAATNAAAGGMGRHAAATVGVAEANVVATASTGGLTVAFRTLNAALGPVGYAFILIGGFVGLMSGLAGGAKSASKEAAELNARQKELNTTWQNSGDGAEALSKALAADSKAYEDAGNKATTANGVYATITKTIETLADGSKRTTTNLNDANGVFDRTVGVTTDAAAAFFDFNDAMDAATGTTSDVKTGVENTTAAVKDQTVALGDATAAWRNKALQEQLSGLFDDPAIKGAASSLGSNTITEAIKAGLAGGPDAIRDFFKEDTDAIVVGLADLNQQLANAKGAFFVPGEGIDDDLVKSIQAQIDALSAKYTLIGELQQKFSEVDNAIVDKASTDAFTAAITAAFPDITTEIDDAGTAADEFAKAIQLASDTYKQFTDQLFASTDMAGALSDAFETLGESLANNGNDFSNMTDAGRANLSALEGAVGAFMATQEAQIQAGQLSAEQATANTAQFISDTLSTLSEQGVDTSQLDFLTNYLAQLTGVPYTVVIGADTSAAIANMQTLYNAITAVRAAQLAVTGVYGAAGKLLGAGASLVQSTGKARNSGPPQTSKTGNVSNAILAGSLSNAKAAQSAKNLEAAQKAAGSAGKKAGNDAKKASDDASEAIKKQKQYVSDLASYYGKLSSEIFESVNAEGDAFKALQSLGQSLSDNGKSFNTVTESGRKNFDALANTLSTFGKTLSVQVEQGVLSADQATSKYREFAQGIYGELLGLGVSADNISGIFRGLGASATGWTGNSSEVQQYAGFITAAADASGGLSNNLQEAADYADALGTALTKTYDRFYGLAKAVDTVQSSMNELAKSYQDSIDKVNELRRSNASLQADLSTSKADEGKARTEQAISLKYGEVGRAADYGAQADTAGAKSADLQSQIDANNKETAALEAGRNALEGNTDAAIDNRNALRDLQSSILDQIKAYAAAGHTTEEVTAYTAALEQQFLAAAQAAGYTSAQVVSYTGVFNQYIATVRSVPNTIGTTVTADTSTAMSALNAIPRGITVNTHAVLSDNEYWYVVGKLAAIPKSADYTVTPQFNSGGAGGLNGAAAGAGASAGVAFGNAMNQTAIAAFRAGLYNFNSETFFNNGVMGIRATKAEGGLIPGFAGGGQVPGKAPGDLSKDNVLARGPGGLISLQGEEFVVKTKVVRQPGVLSFLQKLNSGELPGYAFGGGVGTYSGSSGQTSVVELSPDDRRLMVRAINAGRQVTLYADTQKLASSTSQGNVKLANRGTG